MLTHESIDRQVNVAEEKAIGYVWGRQDMGEDGDTILSMKFGKAYAERMRDFLSERSCFMPNIRDAYEEWRRTGTIK